jgi:hypothetical protein
MGEMVKLVLAVSVLFFVGCGGLDQPINEKVVGGEVVVDLDGNSIKASLIAAGTPGVDETTTVYGYKAYKIPYTTTDEEGNRVTVSGLMVIPTGVPEAVNQLGLSMVSDSHGTIFANAEAPTVIAENNNAPDGSSIILTSLFAFVTLQADYVGFGDSIDHYHPFILKKSLANATADFIVAAKEFAANNAINLNGQLFLTGYSEGGYAAMAALEKIEQEGQLEVTMTAPMAGPYAVEAMAMGVLSQPTIPVPSFMANIAYAYTNAYDADIASVVNEPYASKLEDLFDGSKTRSEIDAELTTVTTGPEGLFNPAFVADFFADPESCCRTSLRDNDVHTWVPETAVRLVHCLGDDVIPYAISELAEGTIQAMSGGMANVALVPVEIAITQDPETALRYGHSECGPAAYGVAATMFAQTREATIGY